MTLFYCSLELPSNISVARYSHLCLLDLADTLPMDIAKSLHCPVDDLERFVNILPTWYSMLKEHFLDENVTIIPHDRVLVSIAWITTVDSRA